MSSPETKPVDGGGPVMCTGEAKDGPRWVDFFDRESHRRYFDHLREQEYEDIIQTLRRGFSDEEKQTPFTLLPMPPEQYFLYPEFGLRQFGGIARSSLTSAGTSSLMSSASSSQAASASVPALSRYPLEVLKEKKKTRCKRTATLVTLGVLAIAFLALTAGVTLHFLLETEPPTKTPAFVDWKMPPSRDMGLANPFQTRVNTTPIPFYSAEDSDEKSFTTLPASDNLAGRSNRKLKGATPSSVSSSTSGISSIVNSTHPVSSSTSAISSIVNSTESVSSSTSAISSIVNSTESVSSSTSAISSIVNSTESVSSSTSAISSIVNSTESVSSSTSAISSIVNSTESVSSSTSAISSIVNSTESVSSSTSAISSIVNSTESVSSSTSAISSIVNSTESVSSSLLHSTSDRKFSTQVTHVLLSSSSADAKTSQSSFLSSKSMSVLATSVSATNVKPFSNGAENSLRLSPKSTVPFSGLSTADVESTSLITVASAGGVEISFLQPTTFSGGVAESDPMPSSSVLEIFPQPGILSTRVTESALLSPLPSTDNVEISLQSATLSNDGTKYTQQLSVPSGGVEISPQSTTLSNDGTKHTQQLLVPSGGVEISPQSTTLSSGPTESTQLLTVLGTGATEISVQTLTLSTGDTESTPLLLAPSSGEISPQSTMLSSGVTESTQVLPVSYGAGTEGSVQLTTPYSDIAESSQLLTASPASSAESTLGINSLATVGIESVQPSTLSSAGGVESTVLSTLSPATGTESTPLLAGSSASVVYVLRQPVTPLINGAQPIWLLTTAPVMGTEMSLQPVTPSFSTAQFTSLLFAPSVGDVESPQIFTAPSSSDLEVSLQSTTPPTIGAEFPALPVAPSISSPETSQQPTAPPTIGAEFPTLPVAPSISSPETSPQPTTAAPAGGKDHSLQPVLPAAGGAESTKLLTAPSPGGMEISPKPPAPPTGGLESTSLITEISIIGTESLLQPKTLYTGGAESTPLLAAPSAVTRGDETAPHPIMSSIGHVTISSLPHDTSSLVLVTATAWLQESQRPMTDTLNSPSENVKGLSNTGSAFSIHTSTKPIQNIPEGLSSTKLALSMEPFSALSESVTDRILNTSLDLSANTSASLSEYLINSFSNTTLGLSTDTSTSPSDYVAEGLSKTALAFSSDIPTASNPPENITDALSTIALAFSTSQSSTSSGYVTEAVSNTTLSLSNRATTSDSNLLNTFMRLSTMTTATESISPVTSAPTTSAADYPNTLSNTTGFSSLMDIQSFENIGLVPGDRILSSGASPVAGSANSPRDKKELVDDNFLAQRDDMKLELRSSLPLANGTTISTPHNNATSKSVNSSFANAPGPSNPPGSATLAAELSPLTNKTSFAKPTNNATFISGLLSVTAETSLSHPRTEIALTVPGTTEPSLSIATILQRPSQGYTLSKLQPPVPPKNQEESFENQPGSIKNVDNFEKQPDSGVPSLVSPLDEVAPDGHAGQDENRTTVYHEYITQAPLPVLNGTLEKFTSAWTESNNSLTETFNVTSADRKRNRLLNSKPANVSNSDDKFSIFTDLLPSPENLTRDLRNLTAVYSKELADALYHVDLSTNATWQTNHVTDSDLIAGPDSIGNSNSHSPNEGINHDNPEMGNAPATEVFTLTPPDPTRKSHFQDELNRFTGWSDYETREATDATRKTTKMGDQRDFVTARAETATSSVSLSWTASRHRSTFNPATAAPPPAKTVPDKTYRGQESQLPVLDPKTEPPQSGVHPPANPHSGTVSPQQTTPLMTFSESTSATTISPGSPTLEEPHLDPFGFQISSHGQHTTDLTDGDGNIFTFPRRNRDGARHTTTTTATTTTTTRKTTTTTTQKPAEVIIIAPDVTADLGMSPTNNFKITCHAFQAWGWTFMSLSRYEGTGNATDAVEFLGGVYVFDEFPFIPIDSRMSQHRVHRDTDRVTLTLESQYTVCEDKGTYLCEVVVNGSTWSKTFNVNIRKKPDMPKLKIPGDLISGQEVTFVTTWNAGYPLMGTIVHEIIKGYTSMPKHITKEQTTTRVLKCEIIVTNSYTVVPEMTWNATEIQVSIRPRGDASPKMLQTLEVLDKQIVMLSVLRSDMCVGNTNMILPHPYTCTKFVNCNDGILKVQTCPEKTCFHRLQLTCY